MTAIAQPAQPACLPADALWQQDLAKRQSVSRSVQGEHFVIHTATFLQGENVGAEAGVAGEEVATVLSGDFRIEAAGESYELTIGEGIVIPPREVRRWTCLSPQGALYRVVTRLDNLPLEYVGKI
jgi:quercetin dioxygenase-like cupin family protein